MTQPKRNGVYTEQIQELRFYKVQILADYPHLKHAIFTRHGGVSEAPFHSLNLSRSVADKPEAVEQNLKLACEAINISPEQTVSTHLTHGTTVLTVTDPPQAASAGQADGLVTATPHIYLLMRFGDCVPILLFDPEQNAVGLAHAGWRGTVQNAAAATVTAMQALGCQPENIIAVIGPAIGPCCYEVGPEVIAAAETGFIDAGGLFLLSSRRPRHAHFDLWEANRRQLNDAGVSKVIQTGLCTSCRKDEFFSHRAEKGQTGRFGIIIGLTPPS